MNGKIRSQPLRILKELILPNFPSSSLSDRSSQAALHERLITDKGQKARKTADVSDRRKKNQNKK